MGTPQGFELGVVVGLDADGDAVEPRPAKLFQGLGIDGIGVCLQGDLGVLGQAEAPVDLGEDADEPLVAEEAGGAAAEVDGVHLIAHHPLGALADVGEHRLEVEVHGLAVHAAAQGVEVTVFALAPAEGHVDIDAQRPPEILHGILLFRMGTSLS